MLIFEFIVQLDIIIEFCILQLERIQLSPTVTFGPIIVLELILQLLLLNTYIYIPDEVKLSFK